MVPLRCCCPRPKSLLSLFPTQPSSPQRLPPTRDHPGTSPQQRLYRCGCEMEGKPGTTNVLRRLHLVSANLVSRSQTFVGTPAHVACFAFGRGCHFLRVCTQPRKLPTNRSILRICLLSKTCVKRVAGAESHISSTPAGDTMEVRLVRCIAQICC